MLRASSCRSTRLTKLHGGPCSKPGFASSHAVTWNLTTRSTIRHTRSFASTGRRVAMLKGEETATMPTDRTSVDRSLWAGLLGDGRPALATVAVALTFAGGLAVYLGFTRQLLPHDLAYLGMSAVELGDVA